MFIMHSCSSVSLPYRVITIDIFQLFSLRILVISDRGLLVVTVRSCVPWRGGNHGVGGQSSVVMLARFGVLPTGCLSTRHDSSAPTRNRPRPPKTTETRLTLFPSSRYLSTVDHHPLNELRGERVGSVRSKSA